MTVFGTEFFGTFGLGRRVAKGYCHFLSITYASMRSRFDLEPDSPEPGLGPPSVAILAAKY